MVFYYLIGIISISGIAYLFYRSILISFLISPFSFFYVKQKKSQLIAQRKWKLNLEFQDGILNILAALNAGYSIENSFYQAVLDLQLMYTDESNIIKEFKYIIYQLKINITVEEALKNLAIRSDIEDIYNFFEVFSTAKRTGGDIIKIIKSTCNQIGGKIEVKREIKTLITGKKLESDIMNKIPLAMIVYLELFSPEFLSPLYHNITGIIIMTLCLVLYYVALCLSNHIMKIEV